MGPWSRASTNWACAYTRLSKIFKNLRKICTLERKIGKKTGILTKKIGTSWQILQFFDIFFKHSKPIPLRKIVSQKICLCKKLLLEGLPWSYNLSKLWIILKCFPDSSRIILETKRWCLPYLFFLHTTVLHYTAWHYTVCSTIQLSSKYYTTLHYTSLSPLTTCDTCSVLHTI